MQTAGQPIQGEQALLVILIVKLAVAAILATMLVRFRRFRQVLLTERRDWPDRLVFAVGFAVPLRVFTPPFLGLTFAAAVLSLLLVPAGLIALVVLALD